MNSASPPMLLDRRFVIGFLVLAAANLLIGNATTSVWDQDEAAYAGFARSMAVYGHWVVPEFPCSQAHRKVPLTFWLIAGSYAAFGVNEFALRLPSVLAIAATAACVAYGGRFLLGAATARLAALMLLSTLFVLNLGKLALTDAVLLLFQTIAALALLRGAVRPSWRATVVLWAAVAAGLLAKGPPIVILVGGMFVFLLIFHRRRRNLVYLHPWFGLPLAMVPLAVWIGLAWQQDQRYVLFLGYWYILRRAGGTTFGQAGPPGAYFLLLFGCLLPWTGYLLTALAETWRRLRKRRLPFVLLTSWLFGGWIMWELLPSKLPTYTLGAFPALLLLMARQVWLNLAGRTTWRTHPTLRAGFHVLVGICILLALAVFAAGIWLGAPWVKALAIVPAAVLAAMGILAWRYQRGGRPYAAVRTLLFGALVGNGLIWLIVIPGLEPMRSVTKQVAAAVARECTPGTTVVLAKSASTSSLPFYVQQAGLGFREALQEDQPRQRVEVDWSLLWKLKTKELVRQVKAQNPVSPPEDESRRLRLERVAELYRSGQPLAFVLDEDQYAALADTLAAARVLHIKGWLTDRAKETTYVIVLSPAALRA